MTSEYSNFNTKKRLLIITHLYSPGIYPRAFRWSTIGEYWGSKGYSIDLVCAWNLGLPKTEVLNGVCVHRTGFDLAALSSYFGKISPNTSEKSEEEKRPISNLSFLIRLSKLLYDNTLKKVRWPDYAFVWYFSALKKANQLIRMYNYDGIISVSVPFTGHLVGLSLKKRFPQIPWLVDIGDPFSWSEESINNFKLYKNMNYYAEGEVLKYADAIAVTTKRTREMYIQLFSKIHKKLHVIPPVQSCSLAARTNPNFLGLIFPPERKIRLVFVGSLYKDIRTPDFLLRVFAQLQQTYLWDKIELHFFGRINDCEEQFEEYKRLLNRKIIIHGLVTHGESKQVMQEADILVNIGNENPYQLPSKVVEYISTGKPVLNLAKINEDSSAEFFSQYPAALSLVDSEEAFSSDKLNQLLQFIEHPPQVDEETLERLCKPFQVEAIATAYEVIFERLP